MKMKRSGQLSICLILLVLNLLFIWGNSALPGKESAEISGGVLEWITDMVGETIPDGEFVLRKLAHFSEFFSLGLLLFWLFRLLSQRGIHQAAMPLLCGTLAALLDETLQVLTPDRGPSVVDVWIDVAGVAGGILLMLAGHFLYERMKHRTIGGNRT